jgi:polyribonucleotide nucleotidyltransferase
MTVEYREKFYAAGKFPGGFIKREGRPSDEEILAARLIDRTLRPLFPKGFQNEVQVFIYVLSADQENDADVVGLTAASLALSLSCVPWEGPVAGVRIGRVEGEWMLNPTFAQLEESDIDLVAAGSGDSVMMVEGGALELSEEEMADAIVFAQSGIAELVDCENEVIGQAAQPKMTWEKEDVPDEILNRVREIAEERVNEAVKGPEKTERLSQVAAVRQDVLTALAEEFPESAKQIKGAFGALEKAVLRAQVLDTGERVDGRDADTVRPIACETGMLPRAHGSALFTRGQTQALVSTTLGSVKDEQRIDNIDLAEETGEARPVRGVSRREIGHGSLAERALQALLPAFDEFPYTIRLVSEILESNGSSSMATVCGGSLALMDAGVPIKAPCAGVAMGLIKEDDRVAVLTDILGTEDHLGDMDFKVAGTRDGITSIQMDIKIQGLDLDTMRSALAKARVARLHILDVMGEALADARPTLSKYAPRIMTIQINPEKIGDLIGPKGKTIRGIQEDTGADVNVDDSGTVTIAATSGTAGEKAKKIIQGLLAEPEIGKIYEGPVKSTTAFGAFIEILPGTDGLCHISELDHSRVEKTEDVVKKGDVVKVKLLSIDERGRMKLSRKAVLQQEA